MFGYRPYKLAAIAASILFIPCIVWGSVTAAFYSKYHKIRNRHESTSCLIHNYTLFEHECQSSGASSTSYYLCFDEQLSISYKILNQTLITTVLDYFDQKKRHKQTEIGNNYSCFYEKASINSIIWNLPNETAHLIQFSIAFGLLGSAILITIFALLCILLSK